MANRIRTLLLNEPQPTVLRPGDEYVPRDFRPASLPLNLEIWRERLFGPGADAYGRAVTLARVGTAIDANPTLAVVARYDDPIITYSVPYPPVPPPVLDGPAGASLSLPLAPFIATGRGEGNWTVQVDHAGRVTILEPMTNTVNTALVTLPDGLIEIPGTHIRLSVPEAGTWVLRVWAAPTYAWTSLVSDNQAGELFTGAAEPDRLLQKIWDGGPTAADRAAAAAIALARRIAEFRERAGYRNPS